jgi:hypothetical protein
MANNKKINVTELDFEQIKGNLKTFLSGQSQFSDYDFEGSGLSILIDLLAYNTHYNALYKNMAVNESFLDSATKRNSVVSRAKEIGYTPRSSRAARATLNVRVVNTVSTPELLTLPKNSVFTSTINNVSYNFYTKEAVTTPFNGTDYLFEDVEVIEGTPLTYEYTVADGAQYVLPNPDVDLSTLLVTVRENQDAVATEVFIDQDTILDINGSSRVYFSKEIEDEYHEIEFGDGVLGKKLENGNVVSVEYFVSNKSAPNGCKTFIYNGSSLLGGEVQITTVTPAENGAEIESISSIKINAPKFYLSQNRAVGDTDYEVIIKKNIPSVKSVNVWGGEDNVPPVYGKVFICIKPETSSFITPEQKLQIKNDILKNKKMLVLIPEIVDAKTTYIEVKTNVYYDPSKTTRSSGDMRTLVEQIIQDYNEEYLEQFSGGFRESRLSSLIDNSEASINSNITTIKLHVPIEVFYNIGYTYNIVLGNPISSEVDEAIISNGFYLPDDNQVYYIDSVGSTLRIFYYGSDGSKVTKTANIGTVDFTTGTISLVNLDIAGLAENEFKLIIKPESYDVIPVRDRVVEIKNSLISVNMIVDSEKSNHIFSSSRS